MKITFGMHVRLVIGYFGLGLVSIFAPQRPLEIMAFGLNEAQKRNKELEAGKKGLTEAIEKGEFAGMICGICHRPFWVWRIEPGAKAKITPLMKEYLHEGHTLSPLTTQQVSNPSVWCQCSKETFPAK
jgi:hypothetical protein